MPDPLQYNFTQHVKFTSYIGPLLCKEETDSANKIKHILNFKLMGRLSEVNKPSLEVKHIIYWYVGLGCKHLQYLNDIDCLFPATAQLLCAMDRTDSHHPFVSAPVIQNRRLTLCLQKFNHAKSNTLQICDH